MHVSEFICTYSDDLIYLQEGRQTLLTHPLRQGVKPFCDSVSRVSAGTTERFAAAQTGSSCTESDR